MISVYIWLIYVLSTHALWIFFRGFYCLCQRCLWKFNGTASQIKKIYQGSSYKGSVQVMKVLTRHRYDVLGQQSESSNFITSHLSFEDPEYVLEDHISLYYVNKSEAIWVELEKGVDPTKGKYSAFVRISQWKLAKKLIIMPIHIFHKLGNIVGKPNHKIVFLTNTARCGSTLVTRVFSENEACLAYSEPDCLNALSQLRGVVSDAERDRIFKTAINLLCKPLKSRHMQAYIIKLCQPTMVEIPHIKKLFPESYHLFLYRNGLSVAKSLAKLSDGMPILAIMQIMGRWSASFTKKAFQEMGLYAEQYEEKLKSDLHFGAIMWAAAIRQYLDFRIQGIDISAARYEDIIKEPQSAFKKIFEYCDIPFDPKAVEIGMSEDSQLGSPISHDKLKHYKPDNFTDDVKVLTDKICDQFKVPGLDQTFIVPGTITTTGLC